MRSVPPDEFHKAFATSYLAFARNGTAAIRHLCPDMGHDAARGYAAKLLKRAVVRQAIKEATNAMAKKFDTSLERLMLEAARIAFLDPKALLDADGSVRDISEMDEDARRAIAGMDVDSRISEDGEVATTKKIKISDKLRALEFIAKLQGMLVEKKQVDAKVEMSLADLLDDDLKQKPEADMFA